MTWPKINTVLNIIIVLIIIGYVVKYFYQLPKYNSGEKAKEIEAVLISGEKFKLSDLKGSYVLLDFWGSWCGPCRKSNSEIVPLYQEFTSKTLSNAAGFEVVSIGIETKKTAWENAILKDKMTWKYHIGQMESFKSPIAKLYGIKEIPTSYFISPEGMIIFVNPKMSEVREYLIEKVE